nr:putative ribonuclease H-like domain-containing protein [Tanacetum cinerariifolium]
MTVNISFLSDFEEINGGYVAFGGNPKGGKISGKGKIKTGKLVFDDVYFVKELKFNLFSVSQICDKKNVVLFTDTECVVLSFDYKLPDENHVLLRVPRENNMYNVDLKNAWTHNFKTMNKLVKGNLVRGLPSKIFENNHTCVACQKGKQHRASCKSKPISSASHPLQRSPSIGFMRPFGCPVTILNTLDPLGKFDGKADEGFLVGYSVNRKAFRVFNSRTRIFQERLHINFLENKPNIAWIGPKWLFDIDTLTKSINYQPVVAGNQPNDNTGIKENLDAGKVRKDTIYTQQYVLLPLWSTSSQDPHNTDDDVADDAFDVKENENDVHVSANGSDKTDMPELEEIVYLDDEEDVDAEADFSNLETNVLGSLIPTTRVHKDHHVNQIIGDLHSAPQTRSMTKMVWVLVDLPKGKRAIGSKWVFRNKKDKRGIMIKNKAILVAQGHTQEEGIDYDEVFTHVARIEAIWLFLAYASFMGFMVYQMDIKSAFLYETIEEEVYFCQPLGFEDPNYSDKVYKVVKALYGLHQAPRSCQDKYLAEILRKFGFTDVKSANTPIETEKPLLKDPNGEDVDVHIYRSMIGSLMYHTSSRSDIMFAVYACA